MNIRQKAVPVFVLFSLIITAHTIQAKEVLIRGLDVVASTDAPMGQGSFAGQSLLPEDSMGSSSDDELFGVEGGGTSILLYRSAVSTLITFSILMKTKQAIS